MVGKMWGNKKGNHLYNRQLPSFIVSAKGDSSNFFEDFSVILESMER